VLIQPNRRLVPGEHVQLELLDAGGEGPGNRCSEELASDPSASMACRDHHPEVRDVGACRMGVPREGEAPDDPVVVQRDEHRSVGMTTDRLQVAALVGNGSPRLRRQEPATGLAADGGCEGNELRRVRPLGVPDRDHGTTTPCPPRRGSPAAPSTPFARRSTAETPPKKRFRSDQRRTSKPTSSSAGATSADHPPSTVSPCPTTASTTCRIAPARRTDPALPATRRGSPPSSRTRVGVIMLGNR